MVILGHGGRFLADVLGEFSPGNPPALLPHMWHNITMLSVPEESIPKPPAHRAKQRPWELQQLPGPWESGFAGKGSS